MLKNMTNLMTIYQCCTSLGPVSKPSKTSPLLYEKYHLRTEFHRVREN